MFLVRLRHLLRSKQFIDSHYVKKQCSSLAVDLDTKTGIATVILQKPPANSMTAESLKEMSDVVERLESDASCKGLIITSNVPRIFCAGMDMKIVYKGTPEQMASLYYWLQEAWIKVYGSKLPIVAAITGHSIAGGCLLSLCCDYRVMVPNFTIGIPAVKIGLDHPSWVKDTFINACGFRETEKALQLGILYKADEALKVGLIDEVACADSILSAAKTELQKWIRIPAHARYLSKMSLRKPVIDKMLSRREEDAKNFLEFASDDSTRKNIGIYLEGLKEKQR